MIDKAKKIEFLNSKIAEVKKAIRLRDQSAKVWRGGTNKSWNSVAAATCTSCVPKSTRLTLASIDERIALKKRQELEVLEAILEDISR